ncbi:MAG: beta strand repeat-containing protein [Candidatus Flexifilum sp.]
MSRSRYAIIIGIGLIALALHGLRSAQANCVVTFPSNILCDNAHDSLNVYANLTDYVDGGGGNDTIIIYSSVGDNTADVNDGVRGGPGSNAIVNNGTIQGNIGIDGFPGSGDYLANSTTGLVNANTGILAGGMDTIYNFGTLNAAIGFHCVTGVAGPGCPMYNFGILNGSAASVYGSGDGDDTLINNSVSYPSQINGSIVLGNGRDYLANVSGYINGPTSMGDGNDSVSNADVMLDVNLGAGADSLDNAVGGLISGAIIAGDGNDTINNLGTIIRNVLLDAGNDQFVNQGLGSSQTALIYGAAFGGDGNDALLNNLYASISGMDGGPGNDYVENNSMVLGVMLGGDGSDTVNNFAGAIAHLLSGDAGNDSVSNYGMAVSSLNGDIGNDTLTNFAGGVASWLDGGPDDDRVINRGFVNAELIGGAGQDSIVNHAGAFAAHLYGDSGSDTVINGGFVNGELRGGDGDDRVVNLSGAHATHLFGDTGSDSIFNGGYLVGQLYGGDGDDTVINAAYSHSAGAQLGAGNDSFVNGGYLNGPLNCGDGNDSVSIGGFVNAGIACGAGNDFVSIFNGVVAGQGAAVVGIIDGGPGTDGLVFNFTVNVPSQAAANAISAAIAAASPAGGTVTIGLVTYSWINFEALYNLLAFNINAPIVITIPLPQRINASDLAAPVAIYCLADAVEVWTIDAGGAGAYAFSVSSADVHAGVTISAAGVTFASTAGGSFTVSAVGHDGKPYSFTGRC